ncbi:NAD(P)-dependent oxidoreductase [Roseibium sp. HPY-6]|uniref:NAD(P)-dependent oxidoreductase n=1 Tax=Roseibium sp. HPY-6 TaxID=3229852 RepID=UPI00338DFAA8
MRVLYDPAPRQTDEIFSIDDRNRFFSEFDVIEIDPSERDAAYERYLPEADIIISQQAMEADRLERAAKLKALINVETNFLPNVDYAACLRRGVHVLTPASVFALPVAEMGLCMALSLARDVHSSHSDFLSGNEKYGLEGNTEAELLTCGNIGFVGFGDLGRALHKLLAPFQAKVSAFDPWLPDNHLRRLGVEPASLDDLLQQNRVIFVVASITTENAHLLDAEKLSMMQDQAMLVLLSRAAIVDFNALANEASKGRLRIATDVFPEEPVAADDPIRNVPGILFSAHRAGALTSALQQIGALVLEDMTQIAKGLPPVACRRAEPETVGRLRSKPVDLS